MVPGDGKARLASRRAVMSWCRYWRPTCPPSNRTACLFPPERRPRWYGRPGCALADAFIEIVAGTVIPRHGPAADRRSSRASRGRAPYQRRSGRMESATGGLRESPTARRGSDPPDGLLVSHCMWAAGRCVARARLKVLAELIQDKYETVDQPLLYQARFAKAGLWSQCDSGPTLPRVRQAVRRCRALSHSRSMSVSTGTVARGASSSITRTDRSLAEPRSCRCPADQSSIGPSIRNSMTALRLHRLQRGRWPALE